MACAGHDTTGSPSVTAPFLALVFLYISVVCLILYSRSEIWAVSQVHRLAMLARFVRYDHLI